MKEETINRIIAIIKEETPDTDVLLVAHHEDEGIQCVLKGDRSSIARAMFTITCDSQSPIQANNMYGIIKDVACNIVSNPSAMAKNLRESIEEYGEE